MAWVSRLWILARIAREVFSFSRTLSLFVVISSGNYWSPCQRTSNHVRRGVGGVGYLSVRRRYSTGKALGDPSCSQIWPGWLHSYCRETKLTPKPSFTWPNVKGVYLSMGLKPHQGGIDRHRFPKLMSHSCGSYLASNPIPMLLNFLIRHQCFIGSVQDTKLQ